MTKIEPICPWEDAVQIGDCTLYLGDCLRVMPFLEGVDAVVADPPYGIGEAAGKNKSRGKLAVSKDYGDDEWDNVPVSNARLSSLRPSCRGKGSLACLQCWDDVGRSGLARPAKLVAIIFSRPPALLA